MLNRPESMTAMPRTSLRSRPGSKLLTPVYYGLRDGEIRCLAAEQYESFGSRLCETARRLTATTQPQN
jgi:hypothetical protein